MSSLEMDRVVLEFRWLTLKELKVMIVTDKLYAKILELILKGVPFEVVRVDEEDAVLTRRCKEAVRRCKEAGLPHTTILEKPRIEHHVTSKFSQAASETTRRLLEYIGSLDQSAFGETQMIDGDTMMIEGLGGLVSFPDRALIYPERLADPLKNAAKNAMAIENITRAVENGDANEQDVRRMCTFYAEQGHAVAQTELAIMLRRGRGGDIDLNEARRWYSLAAAQGDAAAQRVLAAAHRAQFDLAIMLLNGEGGDQNLTEAKRLFSLAADRGDADAQNNLANMLSNGEGGVKDHKEARRLYSLAAAKEDAKAQCMLAAMLERGQGGAKDLEEARRLLRRAADAGLVEAITILDERAASAEKELLAEEEAEKRAKSSAAAAKRAKKKRSKSSNASPLPPIDEASVADVKEADEGGAMARPAEHVSLAEVNLSDIGSALTGKNDDAATSVATALQCVVCMTNERSMACVPCGHRCLCDACGKHEAAGDRCPMCREPVMMFMRVFE